MSLELLVAPAATFIAVSLFLLALFTPKRNEVREKLHPYTYRAAQNADTLARPFAERVIFPVLERFGRLAGSTTPTQVQDRIREQLERAGNPISTNAFLALRVVGPLVLPAAYLGLFFSAGRSFGLPAVALALLLFCIGGYLPKYWISTKVKTRQHAIERALPDALDLIVVSMEAGLAFDGAVAKVVEKTGGPLTEEFQKTLREIQLGKSRREALRQLGTRTEAKDLITLVNAVVQADQMGVSMAQVMRTQADEARLKRRQRAEERAHQAAVKMLFPLVLFILPSVMIVTVGPAALAIYQQFQHGFGG